MTMSIVFHKLLQLMLMLLFLLQLQLLVSHSWSAVGTEVRCLERERQALLDLKAGFVDDYGFLSSWGNEEEKRDCCQWERVRCSNQTGHHVEMLHLQGEYEYSKLYMSIRALRLKDKISTSLMELQHLRYLNLSFNQFEFSPIPEFFGSLHTLTYLDISHSDFVGKIPNQLGSLLYLRYLDLSWNSLEGAIPSQLGNLSQLQYLDVRGNNFGGAIPNQLGNLSSLLKLYLGYNYDLKIHKEDSANAQWLSDLTSLTVLDLSYIRNLNYSHKWLQSISNHSNLQELFLVGCQLTDRDLHYLDSSKFNSSSSLTILDLSENFIGLPVGHNHSHKPLQIISKFQNLRELFLGGCDLSDDDTLFLDPSMFNFSSSLTSLYLSSNNFSTKYLKSLGNICTLSMLSLSSVNLREDFSTIIHYLSGCASYKLQELDLQDNQITGSLSNVSKFPSLKSLYLLGNQMSGIDEGGISDTCSLNSLWLSHNRLNVELPLITHSLFGCRLTLQELYLDDNQIVGGLPDLSKFSSLRELDLSFNQLVGGLPDLSKFSSLRELDLSFNQLVGGLPDLSKFSSLRELDLSYNLFDGIDRNSRLPPQLEFLDVTSNSLEGGIPESFGKICALRSLRLSNNSLSDELPVIIQNLDGCASSLQSLDLSLNQITGTIPDFSKFSSLEELYLSKNQLSGEIPKHITLPSQLVDLYLSFNSKLKGVLSDSHFANMSKLKTLDLSFNSLNLTFSPNWIPPFQLDGIYLRSCCKLGPEFPKWLQTQKKFSELDISDCGISDTVPEWFWSLSASLSLLNISYNNLTGTIPNSSIRFTSSPLISLASNQFEGSIPPFLKGAASIDMSKNKFSSFGTFACANTSSEILGILDLSNNHLSGHLPNCDWKNRKSLEHLDLSYNNLSGEISQSIGSLVELKVLVLRSNKLIGNLPLTLKNCTKLVMLDVGDNKFSGKIPSWIGNAFKELRMLSLRINHFTGSIPLDICHLKGLQFLDLSVNNLTGEIPNCLKNFTAMSQMESSREDRMLNRYVIHLSAGSSMSLPYELNAQLMWKGVEEKFKNDAFRLISIDLSSNQLTGRIPTEITNLVELVSLNLSRNNLSGKIPTKIGMLKSLEFLDLSRNHLSNEIPSSLAWIDRLTMLDLSHNRLSGRIPISTQLQSFDASYYEENLDLCGKPLEKECGNEEAAKKPANVEEKECSILSHPFYISMTLGFITGFWGVFGSIVVNRSWRHAYFQFLNNLTDAIYVMVAINVAKFRTWLNG